VGVFDKRWTQVLAQVLANLGTRHALVVHGEDGLDEITTTAQTFVSEVNNGKISNYEIDPGHFGIKKAKLEDLLGGNLVYNAKILFDVLNGKTGPQRDIVVLNAAAAIYAADKTKTLRDGIRLAAESIDSRNALNKLNLLKEYSNQN
jgi:anthranilate phosphoribosyltransferase